MLVVKSAQLWAVAHANLATTPTGTFMVTAIAMLEEETDRRQRSEGILQAERIHVVAQDALAPMRCFIERMITIFDPEAVPVQIGDYQPIDESEERRLLKKHASLFDRQDNVGPGQQIQQAGHPSSTGLDL